MNRCLNHKRILVTGAFGFIGSHLVDYLKSNGHFVRAVDIRSPSECYLPLKADSIMPMDLRQYENCLHATKGIDFVFNLAANMGGIGYITKVRAEVMRDNVLINANMLEACRQNSVKRFFFSSSACVYPEYKQVASEVEPLREDDAFPASPDTFYGWEKLFTEKLMEAYREDLGLETRIARFHNVYGPYGTYDGGREKAPAALCRKVALARDGDSITIWGDGKQTRSFLYIDDCVRGTVMIMESDYEQPLNIGSDRLVTIDELAQMIIRISGKRLRIVHDLTQPQGVRGRNADLSLVRKVIGWEPQVSLEEGLDETYHWIEMMVRQKWEAPIYDATRFESPRPSSVLSVQ